MVSFKRSKSKNADRGKSAENTVHGFLEGWASGNFRRECNRLVDTKAAGRIIKAAKADFDYFCARPAMPAVFGLIEVKETEHEYRLTRSHVTQLPSMRKRALCGGRCFVLVHHSTTKLWRAIDVEWMETNGDKGSWNISDHPSFASPGEALAWISPDVFG